MYTIQSIWAPSEENNVNKNPGYQVNYKVNNRGKLTGQHSLTNKQIFSLYVIQHQACLSPWPKMCLAKVMTKWTRVDTREWGAAVLVHFSPNYFRFCLLWLGSDETARETE